MLVKSSADFELFDLFKPLCVRVKGFLIFVSDAAVRDAEELRDVSERRRSVPSGRCPQNVQHLPGTVQQAQAVCRTSNRVLI